MANMPVRNGGFYQNEYAKTILVRQRVIEYGMLVDIKFDGQSL